MCGGVSSVFPSEDVDANYWVHAILPFDPSSHPKRAGNLVCARWVEFCL